MNTKSTIQRSMFTLLVLTIALFSDANAADDQLITRVYPVADLIFVPPNYPFQGISTDVPARAGLNMSNMPVSGGGFSGGLGGGGGGGGGFGGGGGGFGGGGFGGAQQEEDGQQGKVATGVETADLSIQGLAKVILGSVALQSWSQVGGPGTIVVYGNRLVISQTREVHAEIKAFLTELRASGAVYSTVTVRAWWLRLDPAQYHKLLADMPAASPPLVNRKQLEAFAADKIADWGEITCFDGQTVHIISGRFRNVVTGVTPVVGQLDLEKQPAKSEVRLAASDAAAAAKSIASDVVIHRDYSNQPTIQLAQNPIADQGATLSLGGGGGGQGHVGYQPRISQQHAGALLELTPTRLQDDKAVVLDLKSKVSQWNENPQGLDFHNVVKLDQTSVISQQLSTTLKAPIGKPVLVGGLSLQPGALADEAKGQLYLVVEAIVAEKAN